MSSPNSDTVVRFLKRFRERLTNFSRRNRELFYKPSRLSLNLTQNPFQELLADERGKTIFGEFKGLTSDAETLQEMLASSELDLSKFLCLSAQLPQELFEVFDTKRAELLKILERIRLEDQRFQKEYGISGAWLLGPFLCWRTSQQYSEADIAITPIFRIPVNLLVNKARTWRLELETQDLLVNPSLRLFLKNAWGIELPERCEQDSIAEALSSIVDTIVTAGKAVHRSGLQEVPRLPPRHRDVVDDDGQIVGKDPVDIIKELRADELEVYRTTTSDRFVLVDVFQISHISASKMALVEDYDRIIENFDDHPIISELIQGSPVKDDESRDSSPRQLDEYREALNHFVVEIDSTQHRAIERSSKSSAVVIQGPPGTGKSQTITNLIAENVALGKKVLFVSEKRAALDVVYSRLKKANIAEQSVLLHSSDLNKNQLYQSFLDSTNQQPNASISREWDSVSSELDNSKKVLHEFRDVLMEDHEESGLSLGGVLCFFGDVGASKPNLDARQKIGRLNAKGLSRLQDALKELQDMAKSLRRFNNHPWINRKPEVTGTLTLRSQLDDWHQHLQDSCSKLQVVDQRIRELAPGLNHCRGEAPDIVLEGLYDLLTMDNSRQEVFLRLGAFLTNRPNGEAMIRDFADALERNKAAVVAFDVSTTIPDVTFLWDYFRVDRGWVERFGQEYRKARQLGRSVIKDKRKFDSRALYRGFLDYHQAFEIAAQVLTELSFPAVLRVADVEQTTKAVADVVVMSNKLLELNRLRVRVTGNSDDTGWDSWSSIDSFLRSCNELRQCLKLRQELWAAIFHIRTQVNGLFVSPPDWGANAEDSSRVTQELVEYFNDLDALDAIDAQMTGLKKVCPETQVEALVQTVLAPGTHEDWAHYVAEQVVGKWYDDVRARWPFLRQVDGPLFERKVSQFKTLETQHRNQSQQVVRNKWAEMWIQKKDTGQGVRLLAKEVAKKRKVKSPREVMEAGALETMLALKPVWLMSPLSISQMLPLQKQLFDVIIFDEASQVRVEDAMPSIYRASKLVVVGDRQQMPPTNFFDVGMADDDDEDESEDIPESILDLALQVYPNVLLEWHYRSRNEALIAFSNRAFYGGRLTAPPNPQLLTQGQPIEFHQLDDAYFSHKNGNRVEAEAVVDRVEELIRENPGRSIGVLAMGQSQRKAIDQVVEERMRDSVFRQLIEDATNLKEGEADVGFFVKNLENVQGDERDIIIMSVGYASAHKGRKLYKNFGPLSKKGGGRRLNVAVTRAKSKLVVFCSFNPDELGTDEAAFAHNPDTTYFGRYLKYARAVSSGDLEGALSVLRSFPMAGTITTRKPTGFNLSVKKRLEELGYRVSTEIGSCGYFIDLGVHHPIDERRFILGIECDGALWHSTPYARDRDKVREDLLRARGWDISRVWSTDWSKDWRNEITKIDTLLRSKVSGTPAQPN